MTELLDFLLRYGYWLTLGCVFAEQMGLPLPAVPVLVGMGALSRSGDVSFPAVLLVALIGSMAADLTWYYLGGRYGRAVLRLICRISLEPDSCVRRTEDTFARRGVWTLLFAKFVPGLNAAAVPLAGMIRTRLDLFIALDTAGLLFWAGAYSLLGYIFSDQIEDLAASLAQGHSILLILAVVIGCYVAYKQRKRRRFLKTLMVDRITPEELKTRLDAHQKVLVLDLRNQLEVNTDRVRIPGAFHTIPEVLSRDGDIPRDQEVVLYCTCPNEATSAFVAQQLHKMGLYRVRPLAGGLGAWRARGFPVETMD